MKKLTTFVLLVLVCLAAQGQTPNAQFCQLEDYLCRKGFDVVHSQRSNCYHLSHQWAVTIMPALLIPQVGVKIDVNDKRYTRHLIDSINASRQQEFAEVLDSIRHTFARVSKNATESYLYECHKNGVDTIKYSLGVVDPMAQVSYFSGMDNRGERYYIDARELFDFRYTNASDANGMGFGYLCHAANYPSGVSERDMKDFDNMAFEQLIQPALKRAMKLKGAKEYPVYWRHDKGFDDSVTGEGGLLRKIGLDNQGGLTTGIDYFIPSQHEATAHALLRELDSLSHGYVDAHPEQLYHYRFPSRLSYVPRQEIVRGDNLEGTANYTLMYGWGQDGFHILSLSTQTVNFGCLATGKS